MGGIDLIGAPQCRRDAGMDPSYLPVHLRFPEVSRRSLDQGGRRLLPHLSDREYPYRKGARRALAMDGRGFRLGPAAEDRKSTRLNSSHVRISYAVFCLKKKKKK